MFCTFLFYGPLSLTFYCKFNLVKHMLALFYSGILYQLIIKLLGYFICDSYFLWRVVHILEVNKGISFTLNFIP